MNKKLITIAYIGGHIIARTNSLVAFSIGGGGGSAWLPFLARSCDQAREDGVAVATTAATDACDGSHILETNVEEEIVFLAQAQRTFPGKWV